MKTVEEFVKELHASEELTAALKRIKDQNALEAFLKKNGCSASVKEFTDFMESQNEGGTRGRRVVCRCGGSLDALRLIGHL